MLREEALYLANLTLSGLKPLSRIEYPIEEDVEQYFRKQGLLIERVTQYAADGGEVRIILVSKSQETIDEARSFFNERLLRLDTETVRMWGRLLGFPRCCVEFFVDEGTKHAPNGFSAKDQSLLFHWACPNCQATKKLIPAYRAMLEKTQQQLQNWHNRQ